MNKKRKDKLTFCVTCALIVALVIFSVNYYDNIALDEVAEGAVLGNVVQAGTLDDVVLEAVDAKKLVYVKAPEIDEIAIKYLHFSNENITFAMSGFDYPLKVGRIRSALNEFEEEVGEFRFIEIDDYENAMIKIDLPKLNNLNIVAEARPIIDENLNIGGGEVSVIKITDKCGYHGTEIHELLHVFGFGHSDGTIMYAYDDECYTLTGSSEYIEHLKFIYSGGVRGIEHPELPMIELNVSCPDEWHFAVNSDKYCCPELDMIVDEDGGCVDG